MSSVMSATVSAPQHLHGVRKLALKLPEVVSHALPPAVHGDHKGPAHENGARPEGKRVKDVDARANPAIDKNYKIVSHRSGDIGENGRRGLHAVLHAPTVVGDHNAVGAGLEGLLKRLFRS